MVLFIDVSPRRNKGQKKVETKEKQKKKKSGATGQVK